MSGRWRVTVRWPAFCQVALVLQALLAVQRCCPGDAKTAVPSQIRVQICLDNAPYSVGAQGEKPDGYDAAIWTSSYKNLQKLVELQNRSDLLKLVGTEPPTLEFGFFDEMLDNLENNTLDFGLCNVFVRPDRYDRFDYTPRYVKSGLTAVMRSEVSAVPLRQIFFLVFSSFNVTAQLSVIMLLIGAFIYAHIIWLVERNDNPAFRKPYGSGIADAFWFAFVTATTAGYGDKVAITTAGRGVSILWIFLGTFLSSTLYAAITSGVLANGRLTEDLVIDALPEDLQRQGLRVGTAMSFARDFLLNLYPNLDLVYLPPPYDQNDLVELLLNGTVEVAVVQSETAWYIGNEVPEYKGKIIKSGPLFAQQSCAIGVSRPNGNQHPLLPLLSTALLQYTESAEHEEDFQRWFGSSSTQELETESDALTRQIHYLSWLIMGFFLGACVLWGLILWYTGRRSRRRLRIVQGLRRRLALPNKAFSLELLEGSARELFDELDTDHQGVLDRRKLEVLAESIDAFNVRKPEILQVLLDEARGPGLGLSSFWYGGRPGSMEGEDTSTTRTVLETRLEVHEFVQMVRRVTLEEERQGEEEDGLQLTVSKQDLVRSGDEIRGAVVRLQRLAQKVASKLETHSALQEQSLALIESSPLITPVPDHPLLPSVSQRRRKLVAKEIQEGLFERTESLGKRWALQRSERDLKSKAWLRHTVSSRMLISKPRKRLSIARSSGPQNDGDNGGNEGNGGTEETELRGPSFMRESTATT